MEGFEVLYNTMKDYNQFKKSKLQPAIMQVYNCSYTDAYDLGKSHCNIVSLWGILFSMGLIEKEYNFFLKDCAKKGIVKSNGYVNYLKPDIFKILGIKAKNIRHKTIPVDLFPGRFFQISINDNHHFMASATNNEGQLLLYDTNDRPYGTDIIDALVYKKDRLHWLEEIIKL